MNDRTFSSIVSEYKRHVLKYHAKDVQRIIPEPELVHLEVLQVFVVGSALYQSALMNSLLHSTDPVYQEKAGQLREILNKAMQPKTLDVPLLSVPQLLNPL